MTKQVSIISMNVAGLYRSNWVSKLGILKEMAAEENVFMIALTETHLSNDVYNKTVI